jgi:hypothetical protein
VKDILLYWTWWFSFDVRTALALLVSGNGPFMSIQIDRYLRNLLATIVRLTINHCLLKLRKIMFAITQVRRLHHGAGELSVWLDLAASVPAQLCQELPVLALVVYSFGRG